MIRQSRWPAGSRIPTEPELCQQFRVSRSTVRQAVELLIQEHLLDRRQGVGTFVLDLSRSRRPLGLSDFTRQAALGQIIIDRKLISDQTVAADAEQASALKVPLGTQIRIFERFDCESGQPLSTDRCEVPLSLADRLTADDMASPLFVAKWEDRQGIRFESIEQSLTVEPCEPIDMHYLQVGPEMCVLVLSEFYYDAQGQQLGRVITRYRADTYRFTARVSREQTWW